MIRSTVIGILFALSAVLPATAADLQKGQAAYDRGDYAAALNEWRPLAIEGNAEAQHNLGVMHFFGDGVTQSHAEALKWWHKAAAQGYAESQFSIGAAYAQGYGVHRDSALADKWLSLSAANGDPNAIGLKNYLAGRTADAQIAESAEPAQK